MDILRRVWAWIERLYSLAMSLPSWLTGAIAGFFGLVGGAAFAWNYFETSIVVDYPKDVIQWLSVNRMPADHYNILVADLEGDTGHEQSGHIVFALEKGFGGFDPTSPVQVQLAMRELKIAWSGDAAARAHAEREGQSWLETFNADVLIWGSLAEEGTRVLRLRFLSRHGGSPSAAKGYQVGNEMLELEPSFGIDLAEIVVAQAVAAANPTYGTGTYIGEVLKPQVRRLEAIVRRPSAALSDKNLAILRESLASSLARLGDQTGDSATIERGVAELRAVASYWQDKDEQRWAATQDRLGNALMRLGERASGTAKFEQARAAFQAALSHFARDTHPREWAVTTNDLGNALLRMGEREPGTARLKEAVDTFKSALDVIDPDWSLDWAKVQNNYGTALATLGARESGGENLAKAIEAYKTAQLAQPRDVVPLDWAMTETNMAAALVLIALREDDRAKLDTTVAMLEEVVKDLKREQAPLQWGATQQILGFALVNRGKLAQGRTDLERAETAFRDALTTRTRQRVPMPWALTLASLAQTELVLAEGDAGPGRILDAIDSLNQSLKVRTQTEAPLLWAESQMLLAEANLQLAKRARTCEPVARGKAAGDAAMGVLRARPGDDQQRTSATLAALGQLANELSCPAV